MGEDRAGVGVGGRDREDRTPDDALALVSTEGFSRNGLVACSHWLLPCHTSSAHMTEKGKISLSTLLSDSADVMVTAVSGSGQKQLRQGQNQ